MKPETALFTDKARVCLAKADDMLARWPDEAGRAAYLAGLHTAQALIAERTDHAARPHRGVQREQAADAIAEGKRFVDRMAEMIDRP